MEGKVISAIATVATAMELAASIVPIMAIKGGDQYAMFLCVH